MKFEHAINKLLLKGLKKNPQNVGIISRLSCQHRNLQETLHLPIQTLYLFTTLSYLGKGKGGKSRMVIILEPLLFYTSTALTENLSSKWTACKKLPSSEIRDFQSHFAHVKDLLAAVLSWQSLTCLTLAAFSKWSTLSKTCSEGSRCYRGWWVCAKEFTTLQRLIGKIHFRLLGLSNQI